MALFSKKIDNKQSVTNHRISKEEKKILREEALDFLEYLEEKLIELESHLQNSELVSLIQRCFRRALEISDLLDLPQAKKLLLDLDELLSHAQSGKHPIRREDINWLYESAELLQELFTLEGEMPSPSEKELSETLESWQERVSVWLAEQLQDIRKIEANGKQEHPHQLGDLLEAKGFSNSLFDQWAHDKDPPKKAKRKQKKLPVYFGHRVHEEHKIAEEKLDHIKGVLGDIDVTFEALLQQIDEDPSLAKTLAPWTSRLSSLIKGISPEIHSISSVSVSEIFVKLDRMMIEFQRRFQKPNILLTFEDKGCFVAKHHKQVIIDILVPLLKNSVEHGIEKAENRQKNGKSEQGVIEIKAHHDDCYLVLSVSDDGVGFNHQHLHEEASRQGLGLFQEHLDDQTITELLFTKQIPVHAKNGLHGYGLSQVNRRVRDLGGTLTYKKTSQGKTSFMVFLPLPPSFQIGTTVTLGDSLYFLPSQSIKRILPAEEILQEQDGKRNWVADREQPSKQYLLCNEHFESNNALSKPTDPEQKEYYVLFEQDGLGAALQVEGFRTHSLVEQTFHGSSFRELPFLYGGGWNQAHDMVWFVDPTNWLHPFRQEN